MIAPHRSPSPGTPSSLSSSSDSDTSGGTYLSKTKHCSVQSYKICIKAKENTLNLATFQQWYQLGWHTPPGFLSYPAALPLLTWAPGSKIICYGFSENQFHKPLLPLLEILMADSLCFESCSTVSPSFAFHAPRSSMYHCTVG